ncbi:MAG: endonuclease MutS2, partial [Acaryochloridaceae cyanobacterium RL_2_7]|nr:endonuclease MutS2 [Acaryochloridaceae cyanobacterium RL_2_7]
DIGDEQSLEQSLSTFSGHVRRIQTILTQITPNSLVLLDEVGAGTDPTEGSALAIALLQHLANHAQLTVATTHYGELKTLKYQDPRFENASVEFDDQSLSPTYRLLWGIPGRSNALIIAERLGISQAIINQAQHVMEDGVEDFNEVITHLEQERRTQETKAKEAANLLANTENLHRELQQKAQQLKEREHRIKQHQEQVLQQELESAKKDIAQVIRKLQRGPQTAKAAHQATQNLNTLAQNIQPKVKKSNPIGYRPKEGDRVRLINLGQTAEVISPVSENGEMMVRFGIMKMMVGFGDVESLTGEKPTPIQPQKKKSPALEPEAQPAVPMIRTSQNTLDLRGHRVAEAEQMMDDQLAAAYGPIWIIHGHGTGKLRHGVQDYLKRHPRVKKYEFAEQADGGRGVTIAHCE